jgi:Na+/proline symporter
MNEKQKSIRPLIPRVIIFVVSICVAAFLYWTNPVAEIKEASLNAWFGAAFLTALLCGLFFKIHFALTGLLVSAGFVLAVIFRIIYDISFVDSSSHNLFPLEIVMWSFIAVFPAFAGALVGNQFIRHELKKLLSKKKKQ